MRRFLTFTLSLWLALPLWAATVSILTTGDMHGYLIAQPTNGYQVGGAAAMLATWKRDEGYVPGKFLALSAGDLATGQSISTLTKGDSVIEAMNLMGYDATCIGNHEFDFTVDKLKDWEKTATFPFLAANLTQNGGAVADVAKPYVIIERNGEKVGVIGLTLSDLLTSANVPTAYSVQSDVDTLRKFVPEAPQQGAKVVIALAHETHDNLVVLSAKVKDLNIPLFIGGHDHFFIQEKVGDSWIVNDACWFDAYARIDLQVDDATGAAWVVSSKQVWMQAAAPDTDPTLKADIDKWQKLIDAGYGQAIGYTVTGLKLKPDLYNFVSDATLAADPTAQVALTNYSGLRQDLPPGPITKSSIVDIMPFDDAIYRVKLTGMNLLAYMQAHKGIGIAGLSGQGKGFQFKDGKPIDPKATYTVLLNDYMYNSSNPLKAADPHPVTLFSDWRTPVYNWLAAHPTSKDNPLEGLIDAAPRG